VVSGIVALMLQVDPTLTPDEVKFRLQASSRPAVDETGAMVYSIFQQGAGLVDAWRAVFPVVTGVANQGLDLSADIEGTMHFGGRARGDADGNYYLEGLDGFMWNDGCMWNDSATESMSINAWVVTALVRADDEAAEKAAKPAKKGAAKAAAKPGKSPRK
jgi:hypothetical protein